jgi:hypothetical protein
MTGDELQQAGGVDDAGTGSVAGSADSRVDEALQRGADLATTPPAEHVEIYEDVHQVLQAVLADAAASETPSLNGDNFNGNNFNGDNNDGENNDGENNDGENNDGDTGR